jgi:hypothetical protein
MELFLFICGTMKRLGIEAPDFRRSAACSAPPIESAAELDENK